MSESAEDKVCNGLKRAIFERRLGPGAPLREQELANYFKVSRTPVRNALRRLAREGIVTIVPNRGTRVVQPNIGQVREAFSLRVHLESMAVNLVANVITPEEVMGLEKLLDAEEEAFHTRDGLQVIEVGRALHTKIAELSRHKLLYQYVRELVEQTTVYFVLYDTIDFDSSTSVPEHRKIVSALAAGDGTLAYKLLSEHLGRQARKLENTVSGFRPPPWAPDSPGG